MDKQFQPIERSRILLGEPEKRAEYEAEGEEIARSFQDLTEEDLYDVAADSSQGGRTRWAAALRLSREKAQQLVDELIQRDQDHWWTAMAHLCQPSKTDDTMRLLRERLTSAHRACRHCAIRLLTQMGDHSLSAHIQDLLDSADHLDHVVAVGCLKSQGTLESREVLRLYVARDNWPIDSRVRAAGALLEMGECDYADYLKSVALHEQSETAYRAACEIARHAKPEALRLFAHVSAAPDHPATPLTVMHVTTVMGKHELGYEQAGLAESRRWLAERIDELDG